MNLAKHPASTVQILGAEKALFRALKTKHDTPKYGLIYHASLVGQTNPKNKGKVRGQFCCTFTLTVLEDEGFICMIILLLILEWYNHHKCFLSRSNIKDDTLDRITFVENNLNNV